MIRRSNEPPSDRSAMYDPEDDDLWLDLSDAGIMEADWQSRIVFAVPLAILLLCVIGIVAFASGQDFGNISWQTVAWAVALVAALSWALVRPKD